jgi:hypothetical protein
MMDETMKKAMLTSVTASLKLAHDAHHRVCGNRQRYESNETRPQVRTLGFDVGGPHPNRPLVRKVWFRPSNVGLATEKACSI